MRKLSYLAVLAAALAAASYAAAGGFHGASNPTAVAATFSAAQVKTSTRTCTTSDNRTIAVTDGTYQGTVAGDASLAGNLTIRARSVVDTTNKVGLVTGQVRVDTTAGPNVRAVFQGVLSGTQVAGFADGSVRTSRTALIANVSADFDPATGFANGKLGGGTTGGNAIMLTPGACRPAHTVHERSSAHGTLTLTSTSVTVAGLTCNLPPGSDVAAKYANGDVVSIRCEPASSGGNVLTKIEGRHKH